MPQGAFKTAVPFINPKPYDSSLGVTDGTTALSRVDSLTFSGAAVSGSGQNATVTITGAVGGITVSHASVTLTAAQVKALHTTPITAVAAQTGKTIVPLRAEFALAFGTTAYTGSTSPTLAYANSLAAPLTDPTNTFWVETANAWSVTAVESAVLTATPVGQALVMTNSGTDLAAGDSPVTLDIWYVLK
jgi:hypothetical protein